MDDRVDGGLDFGDAHCERLFGGEVSFVDFDFVRLQIEFDFPGGDRLDVGQSFSDGVQRSGDGLELFLFGYHFGFRLPLYGIDEFELSSRSGFGFGLFFFDFDFLDFGFGCRFGDDFGFGCRFDFGFGLFYGLSFFGHIFLNLFDGDGSGLFAPRRIVVFVDTGENVYGSNFGGLGCLLGILLGLQFIRRLSDGLDMFGFD